MPVEVLQKAIELNVDDLRPHPENPNRGDVDAIADSLERFGQYRPITVDDEGMILAGHHVWQAARKLGLTQITATVISGDDNEKRAILLADNRLAELGLGADPELLLEALSHLNNLDGTGFDDEYIKMLEESVAGAPSLDDLEREAGGPPVADDFLARVVLTLEPTVMRQWSEYRRGFESDGDALHTLLSDR